MLQRLREFNLYLKLNKCNFHVFHVNFLDFRMSFDEIAMQTNRIVVVKDWSKSKSHKNVQAFIDFANFYKFFVHAFFKVSAELFSLLKKSDKNKFKIKFVMISEARKFMKSIKRVFMNASMLRHYKLDDESMMKTDAFDFVIADIFSQLVEIDDQWRSIVFYFRKMTFAERNYEVDDQEMLVIIKVCKKWRHYIENVKHSIRVIIDHANFRNFFINKAFSRKEVKWWEKLIEFDLRIEYRSEKSNLADDSSRRRDYENEIAKEDKNNENLNLRKWVLIESKNILKSKNEKRKKKYFISSTSNRHVSLSNADSIASETFETIDEMSRSNCFASNDSANCAKFSIAKNAQNFLKREKIVTTVERTLKRKKSFKSLSQDIDKISNTLRLENVADSEDLASRKWIKNVSSKKTTFNVSFLKLRIVLFILQQFDSFAQQIRSFVEKASMKHDKENESVERHNSIECDDVESNIIRKKVDLDFSFKWNIENNLWRWKNKWYISSNLLRRELLKQNHDDSYADHFEHERTLNLLKKKILLKQHEQKCQEIRRLVLDLSSSQARETQISWIVASSFNFKKFKTRLNNEFHHWFVIFEASRNRVRLDFNDSRSLYQIQFIHFIKENLKCWKFNERFNRWDVYQVWKTRLHCHESRFFLHFQILILALLSSVNTFRIQHRLSFADERANRKTKSNFRVLSKKLCQLSARRLSQMTQHRWVRLQ